MPPLEAVACLISRHVGMENKKARLCLDEPSCSTAGSSGFRMQEMIRQETFERIPGHCAEGGGGIMSGGIYTKYTGYHNRRSIRLKGYDYSRPGAYFVTICIHDRAQRLFGNVADGKIGAERCGNIRPTLLGGYSNAFPRCEIG